MNFSGIEQETVAWDNFTTIEDDANSSRYDFGGLTTRADNSSTESIFDAQVGFELPSIRVKWTIRAYSMLHTRLSMKLKHSINRTVLVPRKHYLGFKRICS